MYEFSSKEVRSKFKKTEYGKKTNRWLYISLPIAILLGILVVVLFFLRENNTIVMSTDLKRLVHALFLISLVIACYFDGKRDGAIEQFKKGKK